ncbi:MAG: menaquinone biosynthesis protein [Gemmatimonadaceae bacterium]|nr:menaquinone biosynthesis protein [Gemmatimonadaceae bacterium]
MMRVGRIPYVNCAPVYGAIDRGVVPLAGTLVDGVPSALNQAIAGGTLDVSVVSAVEYARDHARYLLLPDLAISCDGAVKSVMLFSTRPAESLDGERVLVSRSSMTSVALLELLFEHVWRARPVFVPGDAEAADLAQDAEPCAARLVIGDAALMLRHPTHPVAVAHGRAYPHVYDLGSEWKAWTGLPFVFAVWVARRDIPVADALRVHGALIESRDWGLAHIDTLAADAATSCGLPARVLADYLSGLDYRLGLPYLEGLTTFFRRLELAGRVPAGRLEFLPAA